MMNPAQRLMMQKKPIIPPNLRQNVLAWWDARERGQVWYGLNQALVNGNFASTTGWNANACTFAVSAGEATCTYGSASVSSGLYRSVGAIAGHKYYISGYIFPKYANQVIIGAGDGDTAITGLTPNVWNKISAVKAATSTASLNIYHDTRTNYTTGDTWKFKNLICLDLTAIFCGGVVGTGMEPTATEMDAILTADGTAYWEGTKQVLCNPDFKYYWRDMSGNGRHMKLNNFAYSGVDGWQQPYGLGTEGTDSYGKYVATEITPEKSGFSTIAVFKPSAVNATKDIYSVGVGVTYALAVYQQNSNLNVAIQDTNGSAVTVTATNVLNANKFIVITTVYSQTEKKVSLYINGVFAAISSALTNGIKQGTNIRFGINVAENLYFTGGFGLIADINKTLNASEVKQFYDNNKRRFAA